MFETCSTGAVRNACRILVGGPKGIDVLGDLGVGGSMILK
jgi:hypothetical protein